MPLAHTQGRTAELTSSKLKVFLVVHLLDACWQELSLRRPACAPDSQHRIHGYGIRERADSPSVAGTQ
jgi:hypothetical protein